MSWDQTVPDLTQELMRQKVQDCITETLETNQATVTELGKMEQAILEHWADVTTRFAFKVLRYAKAISLMMDLNKVDKAQIDTAFARLTNGRPNNLNNMCGDRQVYRG